MYFLIILAIIFAILQAYATYNGERQLEFIAKPAVMICLFIALILATGLQGAALWFGIGIWLCLFGDVLLLWLDQLFMVGLVAFLLAHISYIIGFQSEVSPFSLWAFILAVLLGTSGSRVLRRIISAMRAKGYQRLVIPVVIYAVIITLMLFMAMLTLSDIDWNANASLLVATGAFSFFVSDIVLAWNRFVAPITGGRTLNILLYHAGQIMLIAGVISQLA